ncbi:hypothetical protein SAMN06296273_0550 [Nitrosomonas ureae]|uniref:Uncharacterized protein n=1 Tax=Nitrosomonas ureae TaxID=44577 RepID=A0A285BUZ9_9PROT|nr:hypothetical protein SAMN06296273_0550 [Nitrosomonas ureae]
MLSNGKKQYASAHISSDAEMQTCLVRNLDKLSQSDSSKERLNWERCSGMLSILDRILIQIDMEALVLGRITMPLEYFGLNPFCTVIKRLISFF